MPTSGMSLLIVPERAIMFFLTIFLAFLISPLEIKVLALTQCVTVIILYPADVRSLIAAIPVSVSLKS